jgi:uncharacterized protein YegP (UPF0339 family)
MTVIWFDIHKNPTAAQRYWFTIRTEHDKLAHSEMYANKADCISTAKLIRASAGSATIYDETGDIVSTDVKDRVVV